MPLTASQEIIEVRLENDSISSLADLITRELSTRPDHRIVGLSTVATGEFASYVRAIVVIEYTGRD